MKKLRRIAATVLAAELLAFSMLPTGAEAAGRLITMEEAIALAAKESADLRQSKLQIQTKTIELNQSQSAMSNQAEKDSGLFAKPHNLTKDLEIRLKIPAAREQVGEAKQELASKERALRAEIEKLYFAAMQAIEQEAAEEQKWQKVRDELNKTETKQRFGVMTKEEADKQKEAMEKADSALKVAKLAVKTAKLQLGAKLGIDPESDFSLEYNPDYALLTPDQLWRFVSHAEKSDFALFKDTEARKLAEEKVNVTRKLYASKFGADTVQMIEAMYASPGETDYELFMANYENMLADIKSKWEGFFFIPFIYIILPIPKSWFQGEYDGLRYFDDIRYSLPVSMMDLDKARLKEQDTRKKLINQVKASFLDAKTAEESYAQALKLADKQKTELAAAEKKRAVGWMKDDEFEKVQQAESDARKGAIAGFYAYKTALSTLNTATSGALDGGWRSGLLPYKDIDDGLQPINEAPADPNAGRKFSGSWTVKEVVEGVTSELTVKVPKELGATHFALVTKDGLEVGPKTPIDGKFVHVSAVFGTMSDLVFQFYKDADMIAAVTPDGYGSSGALTIIMNGGAE